MSSEKAAIALRAELEGRFDIHRNRIGGQFLAVRERLLNSAPRFLFQGFLWFLRGRRRRDEQRSQSAARDFCGHHAQL